MPNKDNVGPSHPTLVTQNTNISIVISSSIGTFSIGSEYPHIVLWRQESYLALAARRLFCSFITKCAYVCVVCV